MCAKSRWPTIRSGRRWSRRAEGRQEGGDLRRVVLAVAVEGQGGVVPGVERPPEPRAQRGALAGVGPLLAGRRRRPRGRPRRSRRRSRRRQRGRAGAQQRRERQTQSAAPRHGRGPGPGRGGRPHARSSSWPHASGPGRPPAPSPRRWRNGVGQERLIGRVARGSRTCQSRDSAADSRTRRPRPSPGTSARGVDHTLDRGGKPPRHGPRGIAMGLNTRAPVARPAPRSRSRGDRRGSPLTSVVEQGWPDVATLKPIGVVSDPGSRAAGRAGTGRVEWACHRAGSRGGVKGGEPRARPGRKPSRAGHPRGPDQARPSICAPGEALLPFGG